MSPQDDKRPGRDDGCRVRNGIDRTIAALAAAQRGVVSREQLLAGGISDNAIKHRIRAGRLHAMHRGVYLVGHSVPASGALEMAALLGCGKRSVLSHTTAARLWRLIPVPAANAPIDVTLVAHHAGARPGLRVHRIQSLTRREVRTLDGLRVTAPARTLLDLAAVSLPAALERAIAEALARNLVRKRDIEDQLARNPGRLGAPALRTAAGLEAGPALTRSEAERRMLALLRAAGLPPPLVNARVGGFEVDFLWREQRLLVEVDGFRFHSSRASFERDRHRDTALAAIGYTVVRVTWRQLVGAPEAVVAQIASALAVR
jgi:very-short-patch-repair endonuclease